MFYATILSDKKMADKKIGQDEFTGFEYCPYIFVRHFFVGQNPSVLRIRWTKLLIEGQASQYLRVRG